MIALRLSMLAAPQVPQECLLGKPDGTKSQLVIRKGCLQEGQRKSGTGPIA